MMKDVNEKIRYDPGINESAGLCYQHCNKVGKKFNSLEDSDLIQYKLDSNDVHASKECFISGVVSLTYRDPFNIILIWTPCSKKDFSFMVS